jgi:hypothetical protein
MAAGGAHHQSLPDDDPAALRDLFQRTLAQRACRLRKWQAKRTCQPHTVLPPPDADCLCGHSVTCSRPAGRNDDVTARSDVWAASRISPILRDAALVLRGTDLWRKMRDPPGDTTLRRGSTWSLQSLLTVADASVDSPPPQPPSAEQVSAALVLLPQHGQYTLDEAAMGQPARAASTLQQP